MLYRLEYLPAARKDMLDIVRYISFELCNPDAANMLANELVKKGESLREMPYICPVYTPIRPLKREYRKAIVGSYLMFYWVDEQEKLITVARIVYGKRNYEEWLI